ncbi:hypothetical protein IWZ01DRAFT_478954 [Phyllosticta capitalensis]
MDPSSHTRLSPSPQCAQSHSPSRQASPTNSTSWPHQNLPHSQHHQQHHQQHRQDQLHPNQEELTSNVPSRSSSVSPPLNAPSTTPTSTATSTPPVTVHLQPAPTSSHLANPQSAHSPPPTPPISAGLPLPLPLFDQTALSVLVQNPGEPPNTPVTPGAFLVSDSEESESDEYEDADEGSSQQDSESEEEREQATTLNSGHWPHHSLRRSPRSATFVRREGGVAFAEGSSRRGSGRKRNSAGSVESERGRSRPIEGRRPSYLYRTDSAPARFLRLEGLGSVIIEAPKRAISARASGGVRVVDTRKRSSTGKGAERGKQGEYSSTSMRKPSAGFGERSRVKKMLESKQMETIRTSSPPRDVAAFKDRRLPARPSSMLPTPREYYPPRGERSENPSPKAAVTPGRRVPSASSEPWRPSLEPLADPFPSMASRITDFPITPIALDLGALSVIADFDELSPTTPRAQNPRAPAPRARASHSSLNKARRRAAQSSRSSSVSATSIRLRSGSVVTVIPPEQTAWQRTVYVAGPIRLNAFQRKTTANADDLEAIAKSEVERLTWHRAPSKPDGIASLDAFQDALDSLDEKATFERRASDDSALDDLVQYFEDWGIPTTECEKDTIDSFWLGTSDDEGSVSKSNRSSMGSEWHGGPPEAGKEGAGAISTSDRYSTGTTASSFAANRLSVVSGGMGAVEVELRDEDASSSKRSSRISLRRSPSLRSKNSSNAPGSTEKKHKSRGSEGQRTRLRRLVMSAGGIL